MCLYLCLCLRIGIIPMHLTVAYLAETYGSKTVPLEIRSKEQHPAQLCEFLKFSPGHRMSKMYMRNLHVVSWFPDEIDTMKVNLDEIDTLIRWS